jgi:hypothetical protein
MTRSIANVLQNALVGFMSFGQSIGIALPTVDFHLSFRLRSFQISVAKIAIIATATLRWFSKAETGHPDMVGLIESIVPRDISTKT